MKVLFVVESYFPLTSGVPVVVKYLAEGLARFENYDVYVATKKYNNLKSYEIINCVSIHRFNLSYNLFKRVKGDISSYIGFIKSENFDYVILECTQCETTDVVLLSMDNINSKFILHSHGFSGLSFKPFRIMSSLKHTLGNTFNCFLWRLYYICFIPRFLKNFHKVFTLSVVGKDYSYLRKHNIIADILPNAADSCFFEINQINLLAKYTRREINNYFICIAYYSDIKNQVGILDQYYKSKSSLTYPMIFIGTEKNSYYEELRAQKKAYDDSYGFRDVVFLTGVERTDISGILSGAKLYLSGSRIEAYSISLIESMSLGVPFVATNVGNASELPGGSVVSDISQMHKKIDDLIDNNIMYEDFSKKGKRYAFEYCQVDIVLNKLRAVLI